MSLLLIKEKAVGLFQVYSEFDTIYSKLSSKMASPGKGEALPTE